MPINPLERQRLQQSVKPIEQKNAYQSLYGLRENPFPAMALFTPNTNDPRGNGDIYDAEFRKAEEELFFKMFVQPENGDRPVPLGFIRLDPQAGGRGNGKSAFLHRIMQRINQQDWNEGWVTNLDDPNLFCLSVHVLPEPKKQRRFWEFALLIFETLYEQGLFAEIDKQLRASTLLNLLTPEQVEKLSERSNDEVNQALATQEAFLSLLNEFGHTLPGFVEATQGAIEQIQPSSNQFLRNFYANDCSLVKAWKFWMEKGMLGSAYQWRKTGVEWLTDGLVSVMLAAGYRRLIILLDEFEKIYISQTARERDEFLDGLRQYFYERPSVAVKYQYISAVLTIHPSIYTYVASTWQRVGLDNLAPLHVDRIQNVSVELGASDPEKLIHLLTTYTDFFRMDEDDPNKGTIYPFSKDALAPAIEAAKFYPRGAIWYAYELMQKAAKDEVTPPISRAFVEEFISGGMQPPQEADDFLFNLPPAESDLKA